MLLRIEDRVKFDVPNSMFKSREDEMRVHDRLTCIIPCNSWCFINIPWTIIWCNWCDWVSLYQISAVLVTFFNHSVCAIVCVGDVQHEDLKTVVIFLRQVSDVLPICWNISGVLWDKNVSEIWCLLCNCCLKMFLFPCVVLKNKRVPAWWGIKISIRNR